MSEARVVIDEDVRSLGQMFQHYAELFGSHLGLAANEKGALGEAVFCRVAERLDIWPRWVARDEKGYDFHTLAGTVEVKTKERRHRPERWFEVSIPEPQAGKQMPDWFAFVSLYRDPASNEFAEGQLVGVVRPEWFFKNAYYVPQGTEMGSGKPSWVGMWNLRIGDLRPISDLIVAADGEE